MSDITMRSAPSFAVAHLCLVRFMRTLPTMIALPMLLSGRTPGVYLNLYKATDQTLTVGCVGIASSSSAGALRIGS
jgi:hypothetical protein